MEKSWCNEIRLNLLQLQPQSISRCKNPKSLHALSWKNKNRKKKKLQLVQFTIVLQYSIDRPWQMSLQRKRAGNASLLSDTMHRTDSYVPPQVGCSTARRCVRHKGRCGRWWSGASSSRWTSWSWSRPPRTNGPANKQVTLQANKRGRTLRRK